MLVRFSRYDSGPQIDRLSQQLRSVPGNVRHDKLTARHLFAELLTEPQLDVRRNLPVALFSICCTNQIMSTRHCVHSQQFGFTHLDCERIGPRTTVWLRYLPPSHAALVHGFGAERHMHVRSTLYRMSMYNRTVI